MLNDYAHYSIGNGTIRVDQLRYLNLVPGFVAAYGSKILIYDTRQLNGYSVFQKLSEYDLFIGESGKSYRCDLTHIKFKTDPGDAAGLDQNTLIPDTLKKSIAVCKFKRYYGYGKSHKPSIYDIERNYMAYVIISKEYLRSKIFAFAVNYVDGNDPIAVIGLHEIETGFAVPLREFVHCIADSMYEDGSHRMSTVMDTIPDLIENTKITSSQKMAADSVINQVYHLTNGYVFLGHIIMVSSAYLNLSKLTEIPGLHYVIVHAPTSYGSGCDIQLTDGLCDYNLIVVDGLEKMSMNAIHDGDWHTRVINNDNMESIAGSITDGGAFVSLSDPNIRRAKSASYSPRANSASIFANREYVRTSLPKWQSSGSPVVIRFGRIPVYLEEMKAALTVADSKWPLASDIVSKAAIEADVAATVAEKVLEEPKRGVSEVKTPDPVQPQAADPIKTEIKRGVTAILSEAYEHVPDFGSFASTANAICLLYKRGSLSVSAIGNSSKYVKFAQGTKSVSGVSEQDLSDIVDYLLARVSTVDISGMEFDSDGQKVVLFFRNLELKNPNFMSKFLSMNDGSKIGQSRSATFMGLAVTPPYRDLYRLAYSASRKVWPGYIFPQNYSGGKKGSFKWLRYAGPKPDEWSRKYRKIVPVKATIISKPGEPVQIIPDIKTKPLKEESPKANSISDFITLKQKDSPTSVSAVVRISEIEAFYVSYVVKNDFGDYHFFVHLKGWDKDLELTKESYISASGAIQRH